MTEHTETRLPLIAQLEKLGWDKHQLLFEPEWRVPKTPSEASRREAGQSYKGFPVDVAIFDHASHLGLYDHLQIIIETKAPNKKEGVNQLEIYMSLEPHVLLGIWTNGIEVSRVYRTPDGRFDVQYEATLPKPTDRLIRAAKKKLTWKDLEPVSTAKLKKIFSRLLNVIVAQDTKSTRRDDQLNSLCNVILAKLEGDKLAKFTPSEAAPFQVWDSDDETAKRIKQLFSDMQMAHSDLFVDNSDQDISLDSYTLATCAYELSQYKLRDTPLNVISEAFQVFRTASLKSEEGQYYTPYPVIRSVIKMMDIKPVDKVLDPACGTGGFLLESYRQLRESHPGMSDADAKGWAQRHLYGVDKDRINVKLTKAIMLTVGDGSTHTYLGDSLRRHLWPYSSPELSTALSEESFSCIVTNPPFGKNLKLSKVDAKAAGFTIARKPRKEKDGKFSFLTVTYEERELGIVFLERCHGLLVDGGRLGIILPETYMFSPSYGWLRQWIEDKLILRGVLNIPMEAFQGFCRAKTNFYIFEKKRRRKIYKPSWFKDSEVLVINAKTCGINKDGYEQYLVDPQTGVRSSSKIDDGLAECCERAKYCDTSRKEVFYYPLEDMRSKGIFVPKYYDRQTLDKFHSMIRKYTNLSSSSLGRMVDDGMIEVTGGHGSPSSDQRLGDIPYIKVSDLRAGHININPTNMIPLELAKEFWRDNSSGLRAYDLISPERASKNIGEFCVLMPNQEKIVLTKEVIIIRTAKKAIFSQFYLMWALSLKEVRDQWERIVFMQTNREDVGKRMLEIEIPTPKDEKTAKKYARPFQTYFEALRNNRKTFLDSLKKTGFDYHIFWGD